MADIWLISGIPGVGKSTTARRLAERLGRAAHIDGDEIQGWIRSGGVWPGQAPAEESSRQIKLNIRNQCLLARSFADAGFTPVVDYVIAGPDLALYRQHLGDFDLLFVVLAPGRRVAIERDRPRAKSRAHLAKHGVTLAEKWAFLEDSFRPLRDTGLWLDTSCLSVDEAVDSLLAARPAALLDRP